MPDMPALTNCARFMHAIDIINSSYQKQLLDASNVGALIRERWLIREQLERSSGVISGWTQKAGLTVPRFTREDDDGSPRRVGEDLTLAGLKSRIRAGHNLRLHIGDY